MASPPPGCRDRLTDLPDALLGHILSFLPTTEAGCTATLSRRWRNIFCNVHTISFEEEDGERAADQDTYYYDDVEERKSRSGALLDGVGSALLCRRRCAGHHVPLHCLRFAFDDCHRWNFVHVDQWLSYVLRYSSQELHLDLRFRIGPICRGDDDDGKKGEVYSGSDKDDDEDSRKKGEVDSDFVDDDEWAPYVRPKRLSDDHSPYVLPRRLFRCTVIRTLSIAYCRLKLPAAVNLPFLETLSITGTRHDGGRSIQRLIASCPRLVDLTLEAIRRLKRVSVLDKRLRRFALRCCHNVKSVDIDASELMSLDYCGTVPVESLMCLHGSPGIPSCTFEFCRAHSKQAEFNGFRMFMEKISDANNLHLHHGRLESRFFLGFPSFTSLTQLALQGPIESCGTVVAVGRVLEQTPNLEVLSLYMDEEKEDFQEDGYDDMYGEYEDEDENGAMDNEDDAAPDKFTVPDESSFSMRCLQHGVKEINMVHYKGGEAQRLMARLLFSNALVLERMCVVFVRGTFASQSKLKNEINCWMVDDAKKFYL